MDYKFLNELFKNEPAKITAESDDRDKGKINICFEGRGIELLSLAIAISEGVLKDCPLSVNDYCEILKESVAHEKNKGKSKEQQDVEKVIIDKMLRDIFK